MIKLKKLLTERSGEMHGIEYKIPKSWYDPNERASLDKAKKSLDATLHLNNFINDFKIVKDYERGKDFVIVARVYSDLPKRELQSKLDGNTTSHETITVL